MSSLREALEAIVAFRDERDWAQYHRPRDLAAALAIETGELQELMLWKTDKEVEAALEKRDFQAALKEEVGDVLIYALLLCHETGVDPLKAIADKLETNAAKYPVDKARGRAAKYTELGSESAHEDDN